MTLTQVNHTEFDPPGPESLRVYDPIVCQFSLLDGMAGAGCETIFRWGPGHSTEGAEDPDAADAADTNEGVEDDTIAASDMRRRTLEEGEGMEEDIDIAEAATYLQAKFVLSGGSNSPSGEAPPEEPPADLNEAAAKKARDASPAKAVEDLAKMFSAATFEKSR